jgi:hypothetical protein
VVMEGISGHVPALLPKTVTDTFTCVRSKHPHHPHHPHQIRLARIRSPVVLLCTLSAHFASENCGAEHRSRMLESAPEAAIRWLLMDTESDHSSNDGRQLAISNPNVEVLPRFRGRRPSLRSLTGTARESASLYRAWKTGLIDRGNYMAGIRGLAVHSTILTACEQEKLREYAASMQQQLEQLQQGRDLPPYGHYGADVSPEPMTAGGGG